VSAPDPLVAVVTDLRGETDDLVGLLSRVPAGSWRAPTPAVGWTVHDQVTHLASFDEICRLAVTDADAFGRERKAVLARGDDFPDRLVEEHRGLARAEARHWFARSRRRLLAALAAADGSARVPWFGPDMSVTSAATARLMETWAHGRDIADALGVPQPPTDRLKHVAHLGVRTRAFSYALRDLTAPEVPVRVELAAPSGATWTWGPEGVDDWVTGTAEDFCLVVAQRRHLTDTHLAATAGAAREWLTIAQAFAGAPGPGRVATTRT